MKRLNASIGLLLIVFVGILLASIKIKDGHNWGDDFALYISQTKALLDGSIGELYQQNKFAMDHSSREVGPYLYPFGFPVLLSPVYYFFGLNFIALKIYCSLFFLLSLGMVYLLFKPYFVQAPQVLLVVAAMAFHPEFIGLTDNVLSDFPFLFFSLLSLWIMQKPTSLIQQLALGLSISFSYFIRDIGIALLPTLLVYQMTKPSATKINLTFKALYFIPYLIFIGTYLAIARLLPKGGANHYEMLFSHLTLPELWTRIVYYWNLFALYFFVGPILLFGVFVAVIAGMITTWQKNLHLIVYTCGILAILLIWPAMQGARFVFPVIPFLVYFLFQGLLAAYYAWYVPYEKLRTVKVGVILLALIVCLAGARGVYGFIHKRNSRTAQAIADNQSDTPEMQDMYRYISTHVPKTAVICFAKPRALRLYTDRNTVFHEYDFFEQNVAGYVLLHKQKITYVPVNWISLHETEHYVLFANKIHKQ